MKRLVDEQRCLVEQEDVGGAGCRVQVDIEDLGARLGHPVDDKVGVCNQEPLAGRGLVEDIRNAGTNDVGAVSISFPVRAVPASASLPRSSGRRMRQRTRHRGDRPHHPSRWVTYETVPT